MQEMEEIRDTCARYIQTLVSLALAQQVFLTSRGRAIKQIRILEESAGSIKCMHIIVVLRLYR